VAEPASLSESEFRRLCEFLYRRTGMVFTEAKRYYVERRVLERMSATGDCAFEGYFARLRSDAAGEIEQFVNAFTVNETYFYREDHQLVCLTAELLAARLEARGARSDPIRIWSLPCSTGEEPYSIAIWLLENWPLVDSYEIEIVGSDIDTEVLALARHGRYGKRALTRLPAHLVEKYFHRGADDTWTIIDELRESVRFTAVNVVDLGETRSHGRFDVIFCRNMLIYFDDTTRRLAAENLYENLMPGAFICLGHAESMSRISPLFEAVRFADAIVYRRPPG
jgi:chemotaxis protein methyltransferase CheR